MVYISTQKKQQILFFYFYFYGFICMNLPSIYPVKLQISEKVKSHQPVQETQQYDQTRVIL